MAAPKAQLTIFTRTNCGHCSRLKGEVLDQKTKKVVRLPGNALDLLLSDQDLKRAGIIVVHYPVDASGNPKAGYHSIKEIHEEWNSKRTDVTKIRGFPTIELAALGDKVNGKKFDEWVTWEGKRGADSIKAWALKTLKGKSFLASVSMDDPRVPSEKTDFYSPSTRSARAARVPQAIPQEEVRSQRVFLPFNADDDEF